MELMEECLFMVGKVQWLCKCGIPNHIKVCESGMEWCNEVCECGIERCNELWVSSEIV